MTGKLSVYIVIGFLLATSFVNGAANKGYTCIVKVVDDRARPISRAEVAAYENFYHYANGQIIVKPIGKTKTTNVNGIAILRLKPDIRINVQIIAEKHGFALDWIGVHGTHPEPTVTLVLRKPAITSGRVIDENAAPIASAKVTALPSNPSMSRKMSLPTDIMTVKTNANGEFRFNEFAAHITMDFRVESPSRATIYTNFETDGNLGRGFEAGETDIEIKLPEEGKIKGIVFDEDRNKIGGVDLLARVDRGKANYQCVYRTTSKSDGSFCFTSLPEGKYMVTVVSPLEQIAEYVSFPVRAAVKSGQTVNGIKLKLKKGIIVEVAVRDAITKTGIKDAWVCGRQKKDSMRQPYVYSTARTDSSGIARLRVLRGKCTISASQAEHNRIQIERIIKENPTKLEFLLDPIPTVKGVVRDKTGKRLPNALVMVTSTRAISKTNNYGEFDFNYKQHGRNPYLFARDIGRNQASILKKITPGDTKPFDIQLEDGITFRGRVTNEKGEPIANANVRFVIYISHCQSSLEQGAITTDADGHFEITAIPPQRKPYEYRAKIKAQGYGPFEDRDISFNAASDGRIVEKSYILQPANMSVSGVVVDEEGNPAAGLPVFSRELHIWQTNCQPRRSTITDANGKFTINRICKGPLRIQAGWVSHGTGFLAAEGGDQNVKVVLGPMIEPQTEKPVKDK